LGWVIVLLISRDGDSLGLAFENYTPGWHATQAESALEERPKRAQPNENLALV